MKNHKFAKIVTASAVVASAVVPNAVEVKADSELNYKPTISQNSTEVTGTKTNFIITNTTGMEGEIYYSLIPESGSSKMELTNLKYEGKAIEVEENYTVLAWVVFKGGNFDGKASADAEYKIRNIDKIPPEMADVKIDNEDETKNPVTVTAIFPADAVTKKYSLDEGKTWITYTKAITFEKNGTLWLRSADKVGNESQIRIVNITNIDLIPPNEPLIQLSTTDDTKGDIQVSFRVDADVKKVEYRLDSGQWVVLSSSFITLNKNAFVEARSYDAVGNVSEIVSKAITNIDNTAPEKAVVTSMNVAPTNENVKVVINYPNDAVGKLYRIDGGSWMLYTGPFDVYENGTVEAMSSDKVGNESEIAQLKITNIDKEIPDKPIIEKTNATVSGNKVVKVAIKYPSDAAKKVYRINQGVWKDYAGQLTIESNSEIEALSIDAAGNESPIATLNIMDLSNDRPVKPEMVVSTSAPTNQSVIVSLISSNVEEVSMEYRMDGGSWRSYTGPIEILENVVIEARAKNDLQNYSTVSVLEIKNIDKVKPNEAVIKLSTQEYTNRGVVVEVEYPTDVVRKEIRVNGEEWGSYYPGFAVYENGVIEVRGTDEAGNTSNVTRMEVNNIDTTKPNIPKIDLLNTEMTNSDVRVKITFDTEDRTRHQYRVNNGEWIDYTGEFAVKENGLVEARSIDLAENYSDIASRFINNIDKTAPVIPMLYSSNTEQTADDVLITIIYASDAVEKHFRINGGQWQPYTEPVVMGENGAVEARGIDAIGNISEIGEIEISNIFKGNVDSPVIHVSTQKQTNKNIVVTIEYPANAYSIQYRVNGEEWQDYYGEFLMFENGTVEARTVDFYGEESEVILKDITNIDKVAPTRPTFSKSTNAITNTPIDVTISYPNDADIKEYRIDGGVWKSYVGKIVIEENVKLEARATDSAGNVSSIATTTISNIDKVAPEKPEFVVSNEGETNESIYLEIYYANDSYKNEYKIGNGEWEDYYGALEIDGNVKVEARAIDEAGNISEVAIFEVKNIDKEAPEKPKIILSETKPTNKKVTIEIELNEEDIFTEYRIDDGLWVEYIGPFETMKNIKIEARSTDRALNVSEISGLQITNIDLIPPSNPVIEVSTEEITEENVFVTITFASDVEKKEYRINGGRWLDYDTAIEMKGNGRVEARGYDAAGNVSGIVMKEIKNIDKGLPATPNIIVSEDEPTNKDILVTIYYEYDVKEAEYRLDNGAWVKYVGPFEVAQNNVTIEARAMNEEGVYSEIAEYKVENIDRTPPEKPMVTPSITMVTNKDVSIVISYSDDTKIKQYRIDDGEWETYKGSVVFTENGKLEARGIDSAGNSSEVEIYEVDNIDRTPATSPVITVSTTKPTNSIVVVSAEFGQEMAKKEYRVDGGEWLVYNGPVTFTSNGMFEARATNALGNLSKIEKREITNIDKVKPDMPNYEISTSTITSQNLRLIIWFSEENSTKEYRVNGGDWKKYVTAITVQANGLFEAREVDEAGNVSEIKEIRILNIDKVAPTKPLVKVVDDEDGGKTAELMFSEESNEKLYRINGGEWMEYQGPFGVVVGDVVEAKAYDEAGNESTVNRYQIEMINKEDIPEEFKEPEEVNPDGTIVPKEPENPEEPKEPEVEEPVKDLRPQTDIAAGIVAINRGTSSEHYKVENGQYIITLNNFEIRIDKGEFEKKIRLNEGLKLKVVETKEGFYVVFNKYDNNGKITALRFDKHVAVELKKAKQGIVFKKVNDTLSFVPQFKNNENFMTVKILGDTNVVYKNVTTPKFDDVSPTIYSKSNIDSLAKYGVVKGVSGNNYAGHKNITRAEFAVLMVRALGLDVTTYKTTHFKDVRMTAYYGPSVQALYASGYIAGKTATEFKPNDEITREETAVLMARLLTRNGIKDTSERNLVITDMNKVGEYAKSSVQMLRNMGIVSGYGKVGQFSPKEKMTHYQMAAILDATMKMMKFKN